MSTNHTPGPWETVKSSLHTDTQNLRQDIVSHGAVFSPAFVAGDILPADARLIAAAPDLLEALESALGLLLIVRDDMRGIVSSSIQSNAANACKTAQAAIAKANRNA